MKKIKTSIFLCAVLLGTHCLSGQNVNFVPSSPQSFQFTRERGVSEDEHTGKLNINIPLLSLLSNKLSAGVGLNYSGAGVKVDDLPNDTGMTWMIDTGGIISRTVNGLPDENASERLNKTYDEIMQTTFSDCDADDMIRKVCYQPTVIDSERDIFHIKVNTISASFYLDENFNPEFLKNDSQVKITTINSNPVLGNRSFTGFEMTDLSGIRYVFGSSNDYTETTGSKMMPAPGGVGNYVVTSYFLKEIIHPTNEKIFFSYENTDFETHTVFENNVRYLFAGGNLGSNNEPYPGMSADIIKSVQTLYVVGKKRISQISSSENTRMIRFNYEVKADSRFKKYLSSIELRENNTQKEKIALQYIFEGSQNNNIPERFFLTSARLYKNGIFEKKYDFSYNDPLTLPKRLSYGQDMFGYFNNNTSNQSLIAGFHNPLLPLSPAYTPVVLNSFGDRRPAFHYASKGVLTEITYPTGGTTKVEYEAPPMRDLEHHNGGVGLLYNNNAMDPDILYSELIIENIYQPQNVTITAHMFASSYNNNHTRGFLWQLIDLDTNQIVLNGGMILGYSGQSQTKTFQFYPGKRYKLIAKSTVANPFVSPDSYVMSSVGLSYTSLTANPVDGYGIRVKSVKQTDQDVVKEYKRLYYNPAEIYNIPSTILLRANPQVSYVSVGEHHTAAPMIKYALHSSNNTSEMYNSQLQDRYPFVTASLGGDHFENGGYEKKFRRDDNESNTVIIPDIGPGFMVSSNSTGLFGYYGTHLQNIISSTYLSAKSNRLMFSGNLLRTRSFVKQGNSILKNKQTNYTYNYNILKSEPNLIAVKMYDDNQNAYCDFGPVQRIANFYLSVYNHHTIDTKLIKEETVDYIDYMPLENTIIDFDADDYSNPNYRKIISTVDYNYENPLHNQVTTKKNQFQDGSLQKTTYAYAHEKGNQLMIDRNMIGIPLETTTTQTKGGVTKTLGKTEVIYPTSLPTAQSGSLVLPLSVKSSDQLTGGMSTDVSYDKYDEKGNVVQYTTKDGVAVTIVWGYNKTQPIARVEGMTYDNLLSLASPTAIITASDQDAADPSKEGLLLEALNSFRKNTQLADRKVTTYTYDPLIGVTSITPPSGIRQVFTYDATNRLRETKVRSKDTTGAYTDKKAAEYKYNYKP